MKLVNAAWDRDLDKPAQLSAKYGPDFILVKFDETLWYPIKPAWRQWDHADKFEDTEGHLMWTTNPYQTYDAFQLILDQLADVDKNVIFVVVDALTFSDKELLFDHVLFFRFDTLEQCMLAKLIFPTLRNISVEDYRGLLRTS